MLAIEVTGTFAVGAAGGAASPEAVVAAIAPEEVSAAAEEVSAAELPASGLDPIPGPGTSVGGRLEPAGGGESDGLAEGSEGGGNEDGLGADAKSIGDPVSGFVALARSAGAAASVALGGVPFGSEGSISTGPSWKACLGGTFFQTKETVIAAST